MSIIERMATMLMKERIVYMSKKGGGGFNVDKAKDGLLLTIKGRLDFISRRREG